MTDVLRAYLTYSFRPVLLAAAVLLPVFALLHRFLSGGWKRTAAYYAFAVYLSAVWIVCELPDCRNALFAPRLNLVPFAGMAADPAGAVLNVFLFLPFGFALPLFWKRYRDGRRTLFAGFLLSLFIEGMELFSGITDVDDLILNTIGAWIGYFIACVLLLSCPRWNKNAPGEGTAVDRVLLFGSVFLTMFFLVPVLRG